MISFRKANERERLRYEKALKSLPISPGGLGRGGFSGVDRRAFRRIRPAREVFPDIDEFPKPRPRGPQKAPTKVQATLRLDREIIDHFRRGGRGWQTRMNEELRRVVEREKKRAKS